MNINDVNNWLDSNIYKPLKSIDMKSNMYRILLVIIIAYIVATIISIFKIHINYTI